MASTKAKFAAVLALSSYAIQLTNCLEATVDGLAQFNLIFGVAEACGNVRSGGIKWAGMLQGDETIARATSLLQPMSELYTDALAVVSATRANLKDVMEVNMALANTHLKGQEPLTTVDTTAIIQALHDGHVSKLVSVFHKLTTLRTLIDTRLAALRMSVDSTMDVSSVQFTLEGLGSVYVSSTCMDIDNYLCGDSLFGKMDNPSLGSSSGYETYYGENSPASGGTFQAIVQEVIGDTRFAQDWSDHYGQTECYMVNHVASQFGGDFMAMVRGAQGKYIEDRYPEGAYGRY